jgi:HK97 family phage portal protein
MSYFGQPKWSTQKDELFVREAYYKLVWVYSCVSLISNCTASIPWCLYRKRGKNVTEITDHPILNIVNKKANPYISSKDFFDIWATYLALQGKFYAKYNNHILPTQMEPLYPHTTYPIPDKDNFIKGFQYKIGGQNFDYESDLVLWSKFFDPLDMYEGLSPIRAMSRTIDTENEAVNWNKTTLQNNAVPPGAISVVNPGPDLQEKLRDDWLKRYAGPNNARVPLVLNSEKVSYISFGLSTVDMDFIEQRKINRVEICSGFGVPSQLVGDPQGQTYANYEEAQKAFWENTIVPKYLDTIKDKLNSDLVIRYADNLILEPNFDSVPALNTSAKEKSEQVRGEWKDGVIKRSEARQALGYESTDEDNVYFTDIAKNNNNIQDEEIQDTEIDNTSQEDTEKQVSKQYKSIKKKMIY